MEPRDHYYSNSFQDKEYWRLQNAKKGDNASGGTGFLMNESKRNRKRKKRK